MRIRFQSGLEQNKQEGLAEPNAYSTPRQGGGQKKKALRLGLHSDLIFLTSCLKHQGQELPSPVHRKTAPSCSHRPKENKPHTESTPSSTAPFSLLLSFSLPFIIHLSLPPSLSSLSPSLCHSIIHKHKVYYAFMLQTSDGRFIEVRVQGRLWLCLERGDCAPLALLGGKDLLQELG